MSKLKWGAPKIEIATIASNGTIGTYAVVANVKKDTFNLNIPKGNKITALGVGGKVVDVRFEVGEVTVTFDVFAKSNAAKPIADNDGIIAGNFAIRWTPEDPTLKGYVLPLTVASCETVSNEAEGEIWKYTFEGLQPASGNIVQEYTPA